LSWGKNEQKKKKYQPLTPRGQFHPIHEILKQDFLDGAMVGVGSLKPQTMSKHLNSKISTPFTILFPKTLHSYNLFSSNEGVSKGHKHSLI